MTNPSDALIDGFAYDLWANRQWWAYLQSKNLGEPDTAIFQHILAAQEVWSRRIAGSPLKAMPIFEVSEPKMLELNEAWTEHLRTITDDPVIHYHRFNGEPHRLTFIQIARHVLDHGAYHRGELRGLCRGRGAEDFPETGLAGYYIVKS